MAGSPAYKVYGPDKTYQAAVKEPEAAAALVAFYGAGSTIRYRHSMTVWTEGAEAISAGQTTNDVDRDHYASVSEIVQARIAAKQQAYYAKVYGPKEGQA